MKPLPWKEAKRIAETLGPGRLEQAEVLSYEAVVSSVRALGEMLVIFEPIETDMLKVRHMIACELHLFGREAILNRLINKHELLIKQQRTQPLVDALPAYAVWLEAKAPRSVPNSAADLANAVNNAFFGKQND